MLLDVIDLRVDLLEAQRGVFSLVPHARPVWSSIFEFPDLILDTPTGCHRSPREDAEESEISISASTNRSPAPLGCPIEEYKPDKESRGWGIGEVQTDGQPDRLIAEPGCPQYVEEELS